MSNLKRNFVVPVLGLIAVLVLAVGLATIQVYRVTSPNRRFDRVPEFRTGERPIEEVAFRSVDGVVLAGWLVAGEPQQPWILMGHDFGESKASLLNLANLLQRAGFNVLMLDFRGHGDSQPVASTLGVEEKRDLLGALDGLNRRVGRRLDPVGVYGVGMGAHAAVLAAVDRPTIRVLVLDGLYPDASYPLVRKVYGDWQPAVQTLGFLPPGIFSVMHRTNPAQHRAASALEALRGRDLLLLAPRNDAALTREMQQMYDSIPTRPDIEGNLEILGSTHVEGLYGARLTEHHHRVVEFFKTRLRFSASTRRPE